MKPIQIPLHILNRVTRTQAVDIQATFDPKRLTVRLRNRMIRSLETGYIPSNAYWGVGLVSKHFLDSAEVFYIAGKMRGYTWLQWPPDLMPENVRVKLNEIFEADHTATIIRNGLHSTQKYMIERRSNRGWAQLYTLKPKDHIPGLLAGNAATPAYRKAVAPYIQRVKDGEPIVINVQY